MRLLVLGGTQFLGRHIVERARARGHELTLLTFGPMLERICAATGARADLVWVEEDRLARAGVVPWDELPLWLDLDRNPDFCGFLAADIGRALAAGLSLRPLEDTVLDTLAWVRERGADAPAQSAEARCSGFGR